LVVVASCAFGRRSFRLEMQVDNSSMSKLDEADRRELSKRKMTELKNHLHSVFWIGSAIFVLFHTELWRVLLEDPRINRYPASFSCTIELLLVCCTVSDPSSSLSARCHLHPLQHVFCPARTFLWLTLLCYGVVIAMLSYLILYVRYVLHDKSEDYMQTHPHAIYAATAASCLSCVT